MDLTIRRTLSHVIIQRHSLPICLVDNCIRYLKALRPLLCMYSCVASASAFTESPDLFPESLGKTAMDRIRDIAHSRRRQESLLDSLDLIQVCCCINDGLVLCTDRSRVMKRKHSVHRSISRKRVKQGESEHRSARRAPMLKVMIRRALVAAIYRIECRVKLAPD